MRAGSATLQGDPGRDVGHTLAATSANAEQRVVLPQPGIPMKATTQPRRRAWSRPDQTCSRVGNVSGFHDPIYAPSFLALPSMEEENSPEAGGSIARLTVGEDQAFWYVVGTESKQRGERGAGQEWLVSSWCSLCKDF